MLVRCGDTVELQFLADCSRKMISVVVLLFVFLGCQGKVGSIIYNCKQHFPVAATGNRFMSVLASLTLKMRGNMC